MKKLTAQLTDFFFLFCGPIYFILKREKCLIVLTIYLPLNYFWYSTNGHIGGGLLNL